jgi:two-component system, NarL family, nitrate/nitrite response regulator NarL
MTRVLIADANAQFRSVLRLLLEREDDITVVGEAASTVEVVEQAARMHADVVVMDVSLPGDGAVETTLSLKQGEHPVGVVLLSVLDEVEGEVSKLENTGHVLKGVPADEIVAAIRRHTAVPVGLEPKTAA